MNQKQFIEKNLYNQDGETQNCAAILREGANFFSYGKHYPLLILVKDKYFVNDCGYSMTTAKHIGHAKTHADYVYDYSYGKFFLVDIGYGGKRTLDYSKNAIKDCVINEISLTCTKLKKLSPRAFKQKEILKARITLLRRGWAYLDKL